MKLTNSYTSIEAAEESWNTHPLNKFPRRYFNYPKSAAVCYDGDHYFIITHEDCVRYRERINQVVKYLN